MDPEPSQIWTTSQPRSRSCRTLYILPGAQAETAEPEPLKHFSHSRSRNRSWDGFPEPEPSQICAALHLRFSHVFKDTHDRGVRLSFVKRLSVATFLPYAPRNVANIRTNSFCEAADIFFFYILVPTSYNTHLGIGGQVRYSANPLINETKFFSKN